MPTTEACCLRCVRSRLETSSAGSGASAGRTSAQSGGLTGPSPPKSTQRCTPQDRGAGATGRGSMQSCAATWRHIGPDRGLPVKRFAAWGITNPHGPVAGGVHEVPQRQPNSCREFHLDILKANTNSRYRASPAGPRQEYLRPTPANEGWMVLGGDDFFGRY